MKILRLTIHQINGFVMNITKILKPCFIRQGSAAGRRVAQQMQEISALSAFFLTGERCDPARNFTIAA
ncbi:hypothetical protein [Chimaeribacter coloradensis]|nr:hypothetical protein [Chimaeribacter coloradensis]